MKCDKCGHTAGGEHTVDEHTVDEGSGEVGAAKRTIVSAQVPRPVVRAPVANIRTRASVWAMRTGKESNPLMVWYDRPEGRRAMCVGNMKLSEMFAMIAWQARTMYAEDPTPEQLMQTLWPDPTDCIKAYAAAHNNQLPMGGVDMEGDHSYAVQRVDWCLKNDSSQWVAEFAASATFAEWLTNTLAANMPKHPTP
jgi:hypothetical protein